MKISSYRYLFFALCLLLTFQQESKAQSNRDGLTGFGYIEITARKGKLSNDIYLGAGGGVTINNSLYIGAYLLALKDPYKYDFFNELNQTPNLNSLQNPYSKNENAVSTIVNNIEGGGSLGFNLFPDRLIQYKIKGMMGGNTISFNEIVAEEKPNSPGEYTYTNKFYNFYGFNTAAEGSLMVKLGSSFKLSIMGGYHYTLITGKINTNRDIGNVFRSPSMFSGPYFGASIIFGNF